MGLLRPNVGGRVCSLIDIAMAAVRIPPEEKLSPTAPLMEEINGFWLSPQRSRTMPRPQADPVSFRRWRRRKHNRYPRA